MRISENIYKKETLRKMFISVLKRLAQFQIRWMRKVTLDMFW